MIIGIGETILDIIFKNDQPQAAVPGGSTFNAIISLGRMGAECSMVTETGDDHIADIIVKFMQENNVDVGYVNRRANSKSHVSLAFLNDKNDAQYQFYKDHANAVISDRMPEVSSDDIVLFGSYFAINPAIRPQVKRMLKTSSEAGATLYYDINFRASHINEIPLIMDNLNENMDIATVVRGSLEDFGYLYGTHDVDEIYEKYIRPHCPCFICTDGGRPIQLRTPQLSRSFAVKEIETVSTIGAGDNFNAGFIYGLMEHGYSRNDIPTLTSDCWQGLIDRAQQFSQNVCMSIYNYVSDIRN